MQRPTFLSKLLAALLLAGLTVIPVLATPGDTTRVSVDSSGVEGNNGSDGACISTDGRMG